MSHFGLGLCSCLLLASCAAEPAPPARAPQLGIVAPPTLTSGSDSASSDAASSDAASSDSASADSASAGAPGTANATSAGQGGNSPQPAPVAAPAGKENADAQPAADPQPAALPKDTVVLHVGDSFAGALGPDLNLQLQAQGVRGVLKQEKATYIPTWASRKELSGYLQQYKPDLILVTLGANELGIVRPEERGETVERLVRRFGDTPCVWIGIPLWKGANPTLLEVIRQHVAPCRYLDSNALLPDLERAKDGIHPSLAARKIWAEAVVKWLAEQRAPNADKPWRLR
jgi:lysophospholipase L1-like esterase